MPISVYMHGLRRTIALVMAVLALAGVVSLGVGPVSAGGPGRLPACAKNYDVVAGDYWVKIAQKTGVSLSALLTANQATTSTALFPGNRLCLPDSATPTTTIVPTTTAVPPQVLLASFPVQGPCSFTDTWLAPRGGGRLHEGVDLLAKAGLYVYAVQDGTLSKQTLDRPGSLSGNAWWLTGANGTYYFYAHLSAFAPDLGPGSKVKAGQIIGFVGRTGNAAGAHLHFEVHPGGGAAVNPTPIVKAVDGCKTTTPPPQPSGTLPPPPSTVAPAGSAAPVATQPPSANMGPSPTAPPSAAAGSLWQFISPKTAFDSASGRLVAGGSSQAVRVDPLAGVPAGTSGVLVRLTATSSGSAGYLATHPCDVAPPPVSTLSFAAGRTAVGSAIVRVSGGTVCVTASTTARVKVEVLAARAAQGVGLQAVSATRALDTRTTGVRIGPGSSVSVTPAMLGVVSGTQALAVTVTMVNPAAAGTLSMGFCGQGPWTTPFSGDAVSSFAMTMRVSSAGWCLTSSTATDVIIDVVGIWGPGNAPAPVDPVRLFDSRSTGSPVGLDAVAIAVPGNLATAVVAITTVSGSTGSSVFAVPCGEGRSAGTVVATSAGRVTTVVVPVRLGGGALCISALQPIDVIIDVVAGA